MDDAKSSGRLVAVSNRLPVVIEQEEGRWQITPGAGGLVTALAPVMRARGGVWIGWPGCGEEAPLDELIEAFEKDQGFRLGPVPLTPEEVEKYYEGFSNETLWPLFHDLLGHCEFSLENWQTYQQVNRRFAERIAAWLAADDVLWIHDYQLLLVGSELRRLGYRPPLAFFLHIPFPSLDLYRRLPWKHKVIRSMLDYDLLGFQTLRDRRNFVQCARELVPGIQAEIHRRYTLLQHDGRTVKVGHFPIGIDYAEFNDTAGTQEVSEAAWYLHENLGNRQIVLGIDRLDYTKGVPERFLGFERALEKYPELRQRTSLLQVVVPSRTRVQGYRKLKEQLDRHAGRINAHFSEGGWIPIHYVFRSLDRIQLLAHYRACEIGLVTPLRDGMNLVAKEYCASSIEKTGVLILSEFAGAADQLHKGALLVNPYDTDGMADAIYRAFTMPAAERQRRMEWLRAEVKRHDVYRWVRSFLGSLSAPGGEGEMVAVQEEQAG
ncbi:MAG: trehalose-6-phosphate synthase [Deltaproteobacteria bacterium]